MQQSDEVSNQVAVKLMLLDINRIVHETHRAGTLEERVLCRDKLSSHGREINSCGCLVNVCGKCVTCLNTHDDDCAV